MCFGAILGAVGMGGGMLGSQEKGFASADSARFNAKVADRNADIKEQQAQSIDESGKAKVKQSLQGARQLAGRQISMFGASGATVGVGSSADVLADTYSYSTEDALTIKYNSDQNAWGARTEAVNYRNKGRMLNASADQAKASATRTNWLLTPGAPGLQYLTSGGRVKGFGFGNVGRMAK